METAITRHTFISLLFFYHFINISSVIHWISITLSIGIKWMIFIEFISFCFCLEDIFIFWLIHLITFIFWLLLEPTCKFRQFYVSLEATDWIQIYKQDVLDKRRWRRCLKLTVNLLLFFGKCFVVYDLNKILLIDCIKNYIMLQCFLCLLKCFVALSLFINIMNFVSKWPLKFTGVL